MGKLIRWRVMEDNNITDQATPEASVENSAESNVSDFAVPDKIKAYWKSQGLTDDAFKDAETFYQSTINRYAEVVKKRQDTTAPAPQPVQTQTNGTAPAAPAPAQPTTQGVDPILSLEATTYGMRFREQFPAVESNYIDNGQYLVDMANAGIPAFVNGHLNRQAAEAFLGMKNQAAASEKALADYKASSQPDVNPNDQMTGTEPDNGLAPEMNETVVRNIAIYNATNKTQHPQTAEAAAWTAKHAMAPRRR